MSHTGVWDVSGAIADLTHVPDQAGEQVWRADFDHIVVKLPLDLELVALVSSGDDGGFDS
jgi:hypothetical protein